MESISAHLHKRLGRVTGYSDDGLTGSVWPDIMNSKKERKTFKTRQKKLNSKVQIFYYSATG
jgi:hypothetical protein